MGKKGLGKERKRRSPPKKAPKPRQKGTNPVRLSARKRELTYRELLDVERFLTLNKMKRPIRNGTRNTTHAPPSLDIQAELFKRTGVKYAERTIQQIRGPHSVVVRKARNRISNKKRLANLKLDRESTGVGGPETRQGTRKTP